MSQRRPRERVDQLREEAGVPLSPDSVEVRRQRLIDIQKVGGIPPINRQSIFEILSSHKGEPGDDAPRGYFL